MHITNVVFKSVFNPLLCIILTDEQNVDVTTKPGAVGQNFLDTSEQHAEKGLLDEVVTVDGRGHGLGKKIEDISLLFGKIFALKDIFTGNGGSVL